VRTSFLCGGCCSSWRHVANCHAQQGAPFPNKCNSLLRTGPDWVWRGVPGCGVAWRTRVWCGVAYQSVVWRGVPGCGAPGNDRVWRCGAQRLGEDGQGRRMEGAMPSIWIDAKMRLSLGALGVRSWDAYVPGVALWRAEVGRGWAGQAHGRGQALHPGRRQRKDIISLGALGVRSWDAYVPGVALWRAGDTGEGVLLEVGEPRLVSLPVPCTGAPTLGAPSILVCHDGFFRWAKRAAPRLVCCVCGCACVRVFHVWQCVRACALCVWVRLQHTPNWGLIRT